MNVTEIGEFTSRTAITYRKHIHGSQPSNVEPTSDTRQKYVQAFSELKLHVTVNQVQQMLRRAMEGKDDLEKQERELSLGEFNVFSIELLLGNIEDTLSAQSDSNLCHLYTSSPNTKKRDGQCLYEVFLGGSCNPTVWRKEITIPILQNEGITYYNPQVDHWYPELVEIEEQAKEGASLLLFVVDNQTRAVSSMVEIGFLIGRGRRLVVVISDIVGDSPCVAGESLNEIEIKELNDGREFIRDIVNIHNILIEPTIRHGTETIVKITQNLLTKKELAEKLTHTKLNIGCLGDLLRQLRQVFTMYDTDRNQSLTLMEACLALRSLQLLSDPLPTSLESFLSNIPTNWSSNGLTFEEFCLLYAELKYKLIQQSKSGWLKTIGSYLWTPVEWVSGWIWSKPCSPMVSSYNYDVFLGGNCGCATWRNDITIPILRQHGVSYFHPQMQKFDPLMFSIERRAKEDSNILLFVISKDTTAVTCLLEAAYYIGLCRRVVLCIQNIDECSGLDDIKLTTKAIRDYNRARSYLTCVANKNRVPVFADVSEATLCCVYKLKGYKLHLTHDGRHKKSLLGTSV